MLLPIWESIVSDQPPPFQNALLRRLSADDIALLGDMQRVTLDLRMCLEPAMGVIENVYFMEDGVASVVAQTHGTREIEVGVIGREGMTAQAILANDDRSPFETFVQVRGHAYRGDAARLAEAVDASQTMRELFIRYSRAFTLQIAATSIANGSAKLEERLARWLLMVSDRAGHSFEITHEFLATMLSVRRSGVTIGLQVLEGQGLIRSARGAVTVLDRPGLIEATKGAYGLAEREYDRLMG